MDLETFERQFTATLADRRLLVTGSYNWTRSAAERNRENLAVTDDWRLVAAFGEEFERLWTEFEPAS